MDMIRFTSKRKIEKWMVYTKERQSYKCSTKGIAKVIHL